MHYKKNQNIMWIEKNIIWLGEIKWSHCGEFITPLRSEGQNEARNLSDLIQCILLFNINHPTPTAKVKEGDTLYNRAGQTPPFSLTLKEIKCVLVLLYSISCFPKQNLPVL